MSIKGPHKFEIWSATFVFDEWEETPKMKNKRVVKIEKTKPIRSEMEMLYFDGDIEHGWQRVINKLGKSDGKRIKHKLGRVEVRNRKKIGSTVWPAGQYYGEHRYPQKEDKGRESIPDK